MACQMAMAYGITKTLSKYDPKLKFTIMSLVVAAAAPSYVSAQGFYDDDIYDAPKPKENKKTEKKPRRGIQHPRRLYLRYQGRHSTMAGTATYMPTTKARTTTPSHRAAAAMSMNTTAAAYSPMRNPYRQTPFTPTSHTPED